MEIRSEYGKRAIVDFIPQCEGNSASFSRISKISGYVPQTSGFGIKFVTQGTEKYVINNVRHEVNAGNYLLLNNSRDFGVEFNNPVSVHGYCFYLSERTINNVLTDSRRTEEDLLDNPFLSKTVSTEFNETVYSRDDLLSVYLQNLTTTSSEELSSTDSYDLYHEIAVRLLQSQKLVHHQINKIDASKLSTRKEVFNRLNIARLIIDNEPLRKINISELAEHAALSEFHFYRCFKRAFGISPHQYGLRKKLEHSHSLLKKNDQSITQVAYLCGFSDIFSFSRAFKKHYNYSPSQIRQAEHSKTLSS